MREKKPADRSSSTPVGDPVDLSTARVISDTFFVSASKIGVTLVKPVRSIVLGRLLGPALYGVLNIPVAYVQILALLSNIGFNTAAVKLIPEYRQQGRDDLAAMIYRAAVLLTVALGTLWCLLLVIAAPWIAREAARLPEATLPIRIYALVIPFLALEAFYAVVYLSVQRGKARASITLVHGLFNIALPIAAVLWRRDVTLVIAGFLTSEVIAAVLYTLWFHRNVRRGWGLAAGPLWRGAREIFGTGFLFFFATLGWNMINAVDRIMVKYYLPEEQLGFYAMAAMVVTALAVVSSTAGSALIPSLTAARVRGEPELFRRRVIDTARFGLAVMAPAVAAVYVCAGDLFAIVLPRFHPSVDLVRLLVFIGFVDITCRVAWAALVAHGRGGMAAGAYLGAALLNIALNLLLIPRYGTAGAATATLLTFIVLAVLLQMMMWLCSRARIPLRALAHPLVLAACFLLFDLAARGLTHWGRLAAILPAGAAAYIVLAPLTGLIRGEDLAAALRSLKPRAHVPHVRAAALLLGLMQRIAAWRKKQ